MNGGSQAANVWFDDSGRRLGPFRATFDEVEPDEPAYLEVDNGNSGYPPDIDFTNGRVTEIYFKPLSGDSQSWTQWQYTSGQMWDRFDKLR